MPTPRSGVGRIAAESLDESSSCREKGKGKGKREKGKGKREKGKGKREKGKGKREKELDFRLHKSPLSPEGPSLSLIPRGDLRFPSSRRDWWQAGLVFY
jgi:hypothetical protein